jgi:hypothetical protein
MIKRDDFSILLNHKLLLSLVLWHRLQVSLLLIKLNLK